MKVGSEVASAEASAEANANLLLPRARSETHLFDPSLLIQPSAPRSSSFSVGRERANLLPFRESGTRSGRPASVQKVTSPFSDSRPLRLKGQVEQLWCGVVLRALVGYVSLAEHVVSMKMTEWEGEQGSDWGRVAWTREKNEQSVRMAGFVSFLQRGHESSIKQEGTLLMEFVLFTPCLGFRQK